MNVKKFSTILLLGFSSGLPLTLTSSTLQAWYTVAGLNLLTIGALSLVGQPYLLKPLWAPLLDRYHLFGMGRRRAWIILMQVALCIGLLVMALLGPRETPVLLAVVALCVAFCSATQDIGIDAYRTEILKPSERGHGSAANTLGWYGGVLVASGVALMIAQCFGFRIMYICMACTIALCFIFTTHIADPQEDVQPPCNLMFAIWQPLVDLLSRKNILLIIFFIIFYKISEALVFALNTVFLLRGMHFTLIEIGSLSKVVGVMATLLGTVVGGFFYPRLKLYRALLYFGFLQIFSNAMFILLFAVGHELWFLGVTMFVEKFCSSLGTVALLVFLMSLCKKQYTATQYAYLSALMAVGRVLVGPFAAVLVSRVGWVEFFLWTIIAGVPGLVILWWLNRRQWSLFKEEAAGVHA